MNTYLLETLTFHPNCNLFGAGRVSGFRRGHENGKPRFPLP